MDNNRNLFLAIALCGLAFFAWQYFVATPQMKAEQAAQTQQHKTPQDTQSVTAPVATAQTPDHLTRSEALKRGGARIAIERRRWTARFCSRARASTICA